MNKSLCVGIAVLAFAFSALGQAPAEVSAVVLGSAASPSNQTAVMTNAVPSGTTESTLVGSGVDLRNWKSVALQLEGTCIQGANAGGNLTLTFARTATPAGPSTAVYETANRFTWSVLAGAINSTNTVVGLTNLPLDQVSGITGLKLVSVQAVSNSVSGLKITVTRKR